MSRPCTFLGAICQHIVFTGHRSVLSGVAHIFGLKTRELAFVLFSASSVRVFVPRSRANKVN